MSFFQKNNPGVEHIELSDRNRKPRLVLIGILIVIAAVSLTVGVTSLVRGNPGWRRIDVTTSELNCGEEFVFQYYLEAHQIEENRQITALYSQAAEKGYWLFTPDQTRASEANVCYINSHVNEEITVDPVLYHAFEQMAQSGLRNLYLAPVYMQYDNLFNSETDSQAADRDPAENLEIRDYYKELSRFINDPAHIQLELLGENRIRLNVSEAYLSYAQANDIREFIDFHWMKNGFIIDYMADLMISHGFTRGYLASVDGFTRNLDNGTDHYSFNIFDRVENGIFLSGRMDYTGPESIVSMRGFPVNQADRWRYYIYADGTTVTAHIDPTDGLNRVSTSNLVCYSEKLGCAELMLRMVPVYLTDRLDGQRIFRLTQDGVYSIWCQDACIYYNDPNLVLYDFHQDDTVQYRSQLVS